MTITIYDRVQETTSTTGTGNITLLGAVEGYQTFDSTVGVSNQTYYGIIDNIANIWEIGVGTLVDSTTLRRDTVLSSTNSGGLITLLGNTCAVFIDVPAVKRIQTDSYVSGSNIYLPIVSNNSENILDNQSDQTILAIDGSGNIQVNNTNGGKVFGVDGTGNAFFHNAGGHQTFGHDGNSSPTIGNANGISIFSMDDDGNPKLTTVSENAVIGFDSSLNPYITNSSGVASFSIDSSTGRPAIFSNVWPSNAFGDLSNDGAGNLAWQSRFRTINVQTGTTYTLAITDQLVTLNNSAAITLTIPTHADINFKSNTEIDLVQLGVGQVTVSPAGGVNLYSYVNKVNIAGQYAGATLKMLSNDNWVLIGNLA